MPLVPLTTRKQYIDSLQPLRPSSTQGSCPICQDNYSREYPPVRLPGCGHIFCRSCILEWFRSGQSNSNTCPLDRTVLFALPPPTPSTDNALEHLPRQRRNAQQFVTLLQDGSIISVNGNLTREGCRILLLDLWYFTYQLYRRVDFDDLDGMPIPERVLRQPIEDSVPRGVSIPRRVWWSLVSIARHMMVMVWLLPIHCIREMKLTRVCDSIVRIGLLWGRCRRRIWRTSRMRWNARWSVCLIG